MKTDAINGKKTREKGGYLKLKSYIHSNFKENDKLPNDYDLAKTLGISRYATLRGLTELTSEGAIRREQGRGTFVTALDSIKNHLIASKKTLIAFVADDFRHFADMICGVESHFRPKNTAVALVNSEYDPDKELSHLHTLQSDGYAGGIIRLAEHYETTAKAIRQLSNNNYPLVLIDNQLDHKDDIPCVQTDNTQGMYQATRHLIKLGHHRIALVTYGGKLASQMDDFVQREKGYRLAFKEAEITICEEYVSKTPLESLKESKLSPPEASALGLGYEAMHQLLCLPNPPTAVVFGAYWLGLTALRVIQNNGLKIPDDISVIQTGDSPELCCSPTALTAIANPSEECGRVAAEIMEKILNNEYLPEKLIKIEPTLIIRNSTAPPKILS